MALFPAYADAAAANIGDSQNISLIEEKGLQQYDVPEAMEVQLLASDSEEEIIVKKPKEKKVEVKKDLPLPSDDYYLDSKLDRGNLRMSTLYYPGRPQYTYIKAKSIGVKKDKKDADTRWRRYFSKRIAEETDMSSAERLASYRRLLAESPDDLLLWETYIDFQEICVGVKAALEATREAVAKLPDSSQLRERLYSLLKVDLLHREYLEAIRDLLAKEHRPAVRLELWCAMVRGVGPQGEVVRAALHDLVHHAPAALQLVHAAGSSLRSAGLWERLVLCVELLVALNMPNGNFPPELPSQDELDRKLQELEDKAINSGLPRHTVWCRVERARAGAHWRASPDPAPLDPQRAPLPHDVADLLHPVVGGALPELAIRLLMLAKVPLLPSTDHARRASGEHEHACDTVLALAYAHRRVRGYSVEGTAKMLELLTDPPHYYADDTGYSKWVGALWDVCCGVVGESLLSWRIRWLHAILRAAPDYKLRARIRNQARSLLKRAQSSPLAFAEFARLEYSAATLDDKEELEKETRTGDKETRTGEKETRTGEKEIRTGEKETRTGEKENRTGEKETRTGEKEKGIERAMAAATHALRAAIVDQDRPITDALYIARVVDEVCGRTAGACALVCAVLRRAPPAALTHTDERLYDAALQECETRCSALEESLPDTDRDSLVSCLSPGAGEWARARIALATAQRRDELLAELMHQQRRVQSREGPASRYWEESACELVLRSASAKQLALVLAALYPGNAYLNLVSAYTPWWRCGGLSVEQRVRRAVGARTALAALACVMPVIQRALLADWARPEAKAAVQACRRATSGAGAASGAAVWAARVECEARASVPRLPGAALQALQLYPYDKWLHVRGASWCGGEAEALADALLETQLRLHALPDELLPLETHP